MTVAIAIRNANNKILNSCIIPETNQQITNGYSRLKRVFTASQNYESYEKIISTAKNKILGNIPQELINLIIKSNPTKKSEQIKFVQDAFKQTAETLKFCQIPMNEAIKNIRGKDNEAKFIYDVILSGHIKDYGNTDNIIKKAEKELETNLKKIIPECSNVNLSYLGYGSFGNAYKLEILDKNKQKIMHDRVIKIYRDEEYVRQFYENAFNKYFEICRKYSPKELYDMLIPLIKNSGEYGDISNKECMEIIKEIKHEFRQSKTKGGIDELVNSIMKARNNLKNTHDIGAEANSYYRLQYLLGHNILTTDIIKADMFDLGTRYSITQCSDNSLPKIKKFIRFDQLGLLARDIHTDNFAYGRMVDFGDIIVINKELLDKTVAKYYKKILTSNNKGQIISRFEELTQNQRLPLRDKIQKAIELAKELLNIK